MSAAKLPVLRTLPDNAELVAARTGGLIAGGMIAFVAVCGCLLAGAAALVRDSNGQSEALFKLLQGSGGPDQAVDAQNTVNGFRVQSEQLVDLVAHTMASLHPEGTDLRARAATLIAALDGVLLRALREDPEHREEALEGSLAQLLEALLGEPPA